MIPPTLTPQDAREPGPAIDDAELARFDDAALEHALKTVNWHPKDIAQFLRTVAPVVAQGIRADTLLARRVGGHFSGAVRASAARRIP